MAGSQDFLNSDYYLFIYLLNYLQKFPCSFFMGPQGHRPYLPTSEVVCLLWLVCMGHWNPKPPKNKITAFFIIKEFDKKKFFLFKKIIKCTLSILVHWVLTKAKKKKKTKTLFIKEKVDEIKIKIKSFWEIGAWFLVLLESPPWGADLMKMIW